MMDADTMATLERLSSGTKHLLTSPHLVGRGPRCALQLSSRLASGEHASFHWLDGGWQLRDLNSRNGTFVDGRRLGATERVVVRAGSRIAFGDPDDVHRLLDDAAPVAIARPTDGEAVVADSGKLFLPHEDDPEVILFERQGLWFIEQTSTGESRRASSGDSLSLGGVQWTLALPEIEQETLQLIQDVTMPRDTEIRFEVSNDREHVIVTVVQSGQTIHVGEQAHNELLLVLAEARLEDDERSDLPERDRGWVHVEDLCRMLGTTRNTVGSQAFRARERFRKCKVAGADDVVENRTGERRLGIARIVIES